MVDQNYFSFFISEMQQISNVENLLLANQVTNINLPNQFGCRIPVKSNWNHELLESLLREYDDVEILECLKFGFPISWEEGTTYPEPAQVNHKGATLHPDAIDKYLEQELRFNATFRPFTIPPFINRIGILPLSMRPKKDSHKRRIILDLSYPKGRSVNDGIRKDRYCGTPVKLSYPTIDTLAERIQKLGPGCKIWKIDLSRYFKQIPICPHDYSLVGVHWWGLLFFDQVMPMGLCSAAYVCQRMTNAITYIHRKMGYWSINYLDDFGSAELAEKAWDSFQAMRNLLE